MERFPNVIEHCRVERITEIVPDRDLYEFKPSRMTWLARWLWSALCWLGALEQEHPTVELLVYTGLQSKKLHGAILEALDNAHADFRQPREIIMGHDVFDELASGPRAHEIIQFNAGPFKHGRSHEVYGVPVRIVPWIKGWAVL